MQDTRVRVLCQEHSSMTILQSLQASNRKILLPSLGCLLCLTWHCGEGNGNPLQYSCLENPMDSRAWQATVHGVAKSQTGLSDFHFHSQSSDYLALFSHYPHQTPGHQFLEKTGDIISELTQVLSIKNILAVVNRFICIIYKTETESQM